MKNQLLLFNDNWLFAKTDVDVTNSSLPDFKPVDIPHDWLIYDANQLYENSIGWYKKGYHFNGSSKEVLLTFDGVYMDSVLYVNDQQVGEWKYGYSRFEHNITPYLQEGNNTILLKVTYKSPNSRWYTGAGIYRNVWLKERSANYIETDGIYVSSFKQKDVWKLAIETSVFAAESLTVNHELIRNGEVMNTYSGEVSVGRGVEKAELTIKDPFVWSVESPHLYQLDTSISVNGTVIEMISQRIGFKEVTLDPDKGFFLNGQHMKLNGVCEHHDLGALGAAFNPVALKRRLEILKDMGVNAIRTAHNMPAKELMDLADEMGFLIVSEAFDMWERPKTPYDYARFFKDWAYVDIKSWVKRDRNHVSLIMWSIGNEIYDTHADEQGQRITEKLVNYVQEFDPEKNAVITIGSNYMPWENAQKCADIVKIAGYNYAEKYYDRHHQAHPDWVIYGSETASTVQSRGIYHFPFEKSILTDDDQQCSALGNSATSWGAKSAEACILAERDTPFSLGQFIWTGFDYIGEPTPYHTKNSYLGQIDTATFPKDSYYIYQAAWTDYKKAPMVHIFPYWDFNNGQLIDVRACSNAPKVELQFNGETIGTFHTNYQNGNQLTGWWKLPYEDGTVTALGYDEDDNIIATESRHSFGEAKTMKLTPDKLTMEADGTDLIFVEITMEDEAGNPVENAANRVDVQVSGAGRLIGLDNGDSTDYDQYKGTSRRLFSGKLMAIIAARLQPGEIEMEVTSEGIPAEKLVMQSIVTEKDVTGVSANMENKHVPVVMGNEKEIPVRNIKIHSEEGQHLNDQQQDLIVSASVQPSNASYQELEWSVVTDTGITSNIATLEAFGNRAKITAFGDGTFRVRCTSTNGTSNIRIISELEFHAEGIGTAYKDPYDFVSAGLFDYSEGDLGNGNERGVATSRDGVTVVTFHDINFGSIGSEQITVPIFALSSEEYPLQIWEGVPGGEKSELLADAIYQKPSKWNVYQSETFQLTRRIKGIRSLSFVTTKKMHIKGFQFTEANRALDWNLAAEADHIYGDRYRIENDTVEQIGNNVSLTFERFDFGEKGVTKIAITGHSPIEKNTIHIRLEGDQRESDQIIEFSFSEDYQERIFALEHVHGVQNVTFLFLPGSDFHFRAFRFIE
ncbi:glycoside hydrolase family 2 TIM barrel-domain containing protein [Gracilibacillus salinarum]|uniref:DUF4982 domain-containing protein n=1 Tax=Gracilibacillus salinarum TaxID=2932255 RepID=A0ABY4GN03_9BACI|nr:glycoside hydrolase family 2 TIM barrel-domain containing protein [Gracilibacillus salinarum]UOQ85112.1 DUF4982 domain-containing protein [Gracilibacillus salinarum]